MKNMVNSPTTSKDSGGDKTSQASAEGNRTNNIDVTVKNRDNIGPDSTVAAPEEIGTE